MLKDFLPINIYQNIKQYENNLNEIRLRVGGKVVISVNGVYKTLNILDSNNNQFVCTKKNIQDILLNVSNNSLYTINDQLINGYITLLDGIRIGVSGQVVSVDNHIKTIKNITSLNIRVPHQVLNCSLKIFNIITKNNYIKNTLIISPPGCGKTTLLRDIVYQLSNRSNQNILVVDEREEIINDKILLSKLDVYKNCTKSFAFDNGIRSMRPDVIITDEISIVKDIDCIENAITCGINVVASIHAQSINDLKNKKQFKNILDNQLFDYYILLGNSQGIGTIEGVFNNQLKCVYI